MSTLGMIAGPLVAGALGIGTAKYNDERQIKQQEKLTKIQKDANKEMAQHSSDLQYDMWNKTNYGAQAKHMEDAGLNVGLMYGMGGAGGATTGSASAGSVGAGSAPVGGNEIGMGLQLGMMEAQRKVLETQAEKNKAEAEATAGVNTELGKTQIASLTQGIENAKAQEALTRVHASIGELDAKMKDMSMEDSLDLIKWTAKKVSAETTTAFNEAYVSSKTKDDKVKLIRTELLGATLRNALTKAQTDNTKQSTEKIKSDIDVNKQNIEASKQSIDKMVNEINIAWGHLGMEDRKQAIEKVKIILQNAEGAYRLTHGVYNLDEAMGAIWDINK